MRELLLACAILSVAAIGIVACGATSGPNAGELMFDLSGGDEDAPPDGGRAPLSLDAGE
jgi:hypothetical protein